MLLKNAEDVEENKQEQQTEEDIEEEKIPDMQRLEPEVIDTAVGGLDVPIEEAAGRYAAKGRRREVKSKSPGRNYLALKGSEQGGS